MVASGSNFHSSKNYKKVAAPPICFALARKSPTGRCYLPLATTIFDPHPLTSPLPTFSTNDLDVGRCLSSSRHTTVLSILFCVVWAQPLIHLESGINPSIQRQTTVPSLVD